MNNKIAAKAFIWKLLERIAVHGVSFVVSVVIARIIDPAAYGIIALTTIFISISQTLVSAGFNTALVREKTVRLVDYSSAVVVNLFLSIIIYLIIYVSSPFVAYYFHEEQLNDILRVLALIIIPSGIVSVQQAYIIKTMQMRKLFFATLLSTLTSGVVGVTLAYKGYGVWALVIQQLIQNTVVCILFFLLKTWKPIMKFSKKRAVEMFSFGYKVLGASLIDNLYQQAKASIIGKVHSPTDLAFYNRGNQIPEMITSTINASMQTIALPVYANYQDNIKMLLDRVRRVNTISSYSLFPILFGLIALSRPIIITLYTDKWILSQPYLCLFCISYSMYPFRISIIEALNALGKSGVVLKMEFIKKAFDVTFLILILLFYSSPVLIAASTTIMSIITFILCGIVAKKYLQYSFSDQISDVLPNAIIAMIMAMVMYLITRLCLNNLLTVALALLIGILVYYMLSKVIKSDGLKLFNSILRSMRKRV